MTIEKWLKLGSSPLGDFRIFSLRADRLRSPRTGHEQEFFVLDCVDWVNVVAVTTEGQAVLVEQYRHGSGTVELEIPGGMMDAADASPVEAAVRELREETGFEGERARIIGEVYANPAILSNRCYTVLVENCRPRHGLSLDHGEDLATRLVPAGDLPRMVAAGQFRHSLVVVALTHYDLLLRGLK